MDNYVLFFRMDITTKENQPTPEEMQQYMVLWDAWIQSISLQGKLRGGNHLSTDGRVITSNGIEKNIFIEKKISVAGYIVICAKNYEEATEIASKCPILEGEGNSVEVRKVS